MRTYSDLLGLCATWIFTFSPIGVLPTEEIFLVSPEHAEIPCFVPIKRKARTERLLPSKLFSHQIGSTGRVGNNNRNAQIGSKCVLSSIGSKPLGIASTKLPITKLFSSLFFDEENDEDWVDDNGEYEIQYQGRAFGSEDADGKDVIKDKKNKGNESSDASSFQDEAGVLDLDDTNEEYYERLFLQQSVSSSDDAYDEVGIEVLKTPEEEYLKGEESEKEFYKKSEEQYKERNRLEREWRDRVVTLRREALNGRKLHRRDMRKQLLEERARFLALRALRLKTMMPWLTKQQLRPSPTLSLGAARNFPVEDDADGVEEKLYGKRFKTALGVYIRLLEALEEMKAESKRDSIDFIINREAEIASESAMSCLQLSSQTEPMSEYIVDVNRHRQVSNHQKDISVNYVLQMNEKQKDRMSALITLVLHGGKLFDPSYGSSPGKDDVGHTSALEDTLTMPDLESVTTEDLSLALKIRGNMKRRGPPAKRRKKILQLMFESYSKELF